MSKLALHWQILAALVLALAAGLLSGTEGAIGPVRLLGVYDFLGTLFMNALKMLVVPLVLSSMIVGIGSVSAGLGRLGAMTAAYYLGTGLAAILMGLLWINVFTPGLVDGQPAGERFARAADTAEMVSRIEGKGADDLASVVLSIVPPNIVQAAADMQMLGLIGFGLLFGYFMARLPAELREPMHRFWQGVNEIMLRITFLVMRFAPLGVFGLVAKTVAVTGFAAFAPLAAFFGSVLLGLLLHMTLTLSLVLHFVAGIDPRRQLRAMLPALFTAFSTASSNATLPVTLDCLRKNVGVSDRVTGLVVPIGATVNTDGTALYECAAALFIAQVYGVELTLGLQFLVVTLALLTSVGVAGIPAASLVAIVIILSAIGLPAEALGLILITDRVLDMCRTAVNVYGDSCGAAVIASREGEALFRNARH